jgi:hypothetical protein
MIAIKQILLALGLTASPLEHPLEPCFGHCQISDKGLAVIRHFEGFSPMPYDDGAGYLTVGFGHKILPGEKFDAPVLGEAAENLLRKDLEPKVKAVNVSVRVPLYQWQWDAVFSLSFNILVIYQFRQLFYAASPLPEHSWGFSDSFSGQPL